MLDRTCLPPLTGVRLLPDGPGARARPRIRRRPLPLAAAASVLAGCTGRQSALDPAGHGAARIAELFWWMAGGAMLVWLFMLWLGWSALRGRVSRHTEQQARLYVIGGGVLFPTVILAALLAYGLGMMPELRAPAPPGALTISVSGEQWWWRVRYRLPGGDAVELANEIRLPVGEAVEFELESPDVIHAFWIPPLGGKMDMIPGRRTRLVLHPTRVGTFRGQCAEFCGDSHALMAFPVVVMDRPSFGAWLAGQQRVAVAVAEPSLARGRDAFLEHGCAACHSVRGTPARGVIGPDLTHVGSRLSIGADVLPNEPPGFVRWLAETDRVKPGVLMPHFGMLPREELDALAAYLESLQ
jgi:cytochrome c oxidase subunit 2